MGANNPVFQLWSEALYEWPELETTVQCVVSVGTGVMSATPFKDDVFHIISSLAKIITECDATAEKFLQDKRMLDTQKRYYRFNVEEGLGDVAMEDSKQKPFIAAATNKYVETHKVFKALGDCATMLRVGYVRVHHSMIVRAA
ncbi:hypothetical protein K4K61_000338 [Colletotrichum sp. SAR11_59]|nr:hypothetical protein K4K61_000338 [Colletotrichum sp. SAR11_59]